MTGPNSVVAIVDDDQATREALEDLIESLGFESRTYCSANHFLADQGDRRNFGCLLLDVDMPGLTGLELQAVLTAKLNPTPIIFVTSCQDERTRTSALKGGATGFFLKPVDVPRLIDTVVFSIRRGEVKHLLTVRSYGD